MQHYFSEKQQSPLRLRKLAATLRGKYFEFYSGSGVFSKSRIDTGTELLANAMELADTTRILDLGCGIGVIGIVAASCSKSKVLMVDVNERALQLAELNVKLNKVTAAVRKSNLYEQVHGLFTAIIVNPPQTAGKKICYEIIDKAPAHLKEKGTLQLVARHNKGGRDLSRKMKEVFGNVREIAKQAGYRVYVAEKE